MFSRSHVRGIVRSAMVCILALVGGGCGSQAQRSSARGPLVMPFLEGRGAAVLAMYTPPGFRLTGLDESQTVEGIDFNLLLAVFRDGTVVWSDDPSGEGGPYWIGRVDAAEYARIL